MKNAIHVITGIMLIGNLLTGTGEANAQEMLAGISKVDITAPVGYPLGGYGARTEGSKGVHDPLYARVLILKTGETTVAVVSLDVVEFFSSRVSKTAREKWGIDCVLLNSSHTHSGPDPKEKEWWNYEKIKHDPWYASVEDRIIAAIGEAANNLFPAKIAAGKGTADISCNRRRVNADGTVTMLWRVPGKTPTGPIDPTVGVIRIDDVSGRTRAVLAHFACHPATLTAENLYFSADFPGAAVARIEENMGEDCTGFFLQGACGDLTTFRPIEYDHDLNYRMMRESGETLGLEAVRVAKKLIPELNYKSSIQVRVDTMNFKMRFEPPKTMNIGIVTVLINNEIAFLSMPGEPFVELQMDLVSRSIVPNTFLLGFTTCGVGEMTPFYIPTIRAAVEGGYGADTGTRMEPQAGARIVDRGIINLYFMLGYLDPVPVDAVTD